MTIIVTHDGRFHADEALAIALLLRSPAIDPATVVVKRSRDPQVWATADYLVDVGGEYDPSRHRYDHHQSAFDAHFDDHHRTTILSSAGIVYKHHGKDVIAHQLGLDDRATIDMLFVKVYEKVVEAFDAVDNGVERYGSECKAKYNKPYDIFSMVGDLNPEWNEEGVTGEELMRRFMSAVDLCGRAFDSHLQYYGRSWLAARQIVKDSITTSLQDQQCVAARTVKLSRNCPWKEHLFELEQEMDLQGHFLFAVYPEDTNKTFRVQAVPIALDSFETRRGLKTEWRGVRDGELDAVLAGPAGAIFVHKTGFIGGHKSEEGALFMALQSSLYNQ